MLCCSNRATELLPPVPHIAEIIRTEKGAESSRHGGMLLEVRSAASPGLLMGEGLGVMLGAVGLR